MLTMIRRGAVVAVEAASEAAEPSAAVAGTLVSVPTATISHVIQPARFLMSSSGDRHEQPDSQIVSCCDY